MIIIKRKNSFFLFFLLIFNLSCKTKNIKNDAEKTNTYYYLKYDKLENKDVDIDNDINVYLSNLINSEKIEFIFISILNSKNSLNSTLTLWFQDDFKNLIFEEYILEDKKYTLLKKEVFKNIDLNNNYKIENVFFKKTDGSCFGCLTGLKIIKINNSFSKYYFWGNYYNGLKEEDKQKVIVFKELTEKLNIISEGKVPPAATRPTK